MSAAFVANGHEISQEQRKAAIEVMRRPRFSTNDMHAALIEAGVPNEDYTVERAADRLRQQWRKAGTIRPVKGVAGHWEAVA